jgi:hypothetical protein
MLSFGVEFDDSREDVKANSDESQIGHDHSEEKEISKKDDDDECDLPY